MRKAMQILKKPKVVPAPPDDKANAKTPMCRDTFTSPLAQGAIVRRDTLPLPSLDRRGKTAAERPYLKADEFARVRHRFKEGIERGNVHAVREALHHVGGRQLIALVEGPIEGRDVPPRLPLSVAAHGGFTDVVEELLRHTHPFRGEQDPVSETVWLPTLFAAYSGQVSALVKLCEASGSYAEALRAMEQHVHPRTARCLRSRVPESAFAAPLARAIMRGGLDMGLSPISTLIREAHANPDQVLGLQDYDGGEVFHSLPSDGDAPQPTHVSALSYAMCFQRWDAAFELLDLGANPSGNLKEEGELLAKNCRAPLMLALKAHHVPLCTKLLRHGARSAPSLLDLPFDSPQQKIEPLYLLLLQHGCSPATPEAGVTLAAKAKSHGQHQLAELIYMQCAQLRGKQTGGEAAERSRKALEAYIDHFTRGPTADDATTPSTFVASTFNDPVRPVLMQRCINAIPTVSSIKDATARRRRPEGDQEEEQREPRAARRPALPAAGVAAQRPLAQRAAAQRAAAQRPAAQLLEQ